MQKKRQQKNLPKPIRPCDSCLFLATRTTPKPASFLLFGCSKLKLKFGLESDFKYGWQGSKADKHEFKIADVPVKCLSYEVRK